MRMTRQLELRFYAGLNDFLPAALRQQTYQLVIERETSIKNLIESQGVPHTEVALILVNGEAVGFEHRVADAERIAIYPALTHPMLAEPLQQTNPMHNHSTPRCFVLDCHLGRLARYLRQFGFDTLYRNDYHDAELADISAAEQRILLTRDRALLKRKIIEHGYFVRATAPMQQFHEVMQRYALYAFIAPFGRCTRCNGEVVSADKAEVSDQLKPNTLRHYDIFWRCNGCGQVYWEGSHYQHMQSTTEQILEHARTAQG